MATNGTAAMELETPTIATNSKLTVIDGGCERNAAQTNALVVPSDPIDWNFSNDNELDVVFDGFGDGLEEMDWKKFDEKRGGRPGWDCLVKITSTTEGFTRGEDPKPSRDYKGIIWKFFDGPAATCVFSDKMDHLRVQLEVEKNDVNIHRTDTTQKALENNEDVASMAIVPFGQPVFANAPNKAPQSPQSAQTSTQQDESPPKKKAKEWVRVDRFAEYEILGELWWSVVMPEDTIPPQEGTYVRVNGVWGRWHFKKDGTLCTRRDGTPITYNKASSDVSKELSLTKREELDILSNLSLCRHLFDLNLASSESVKLPIIVLNNPNEGASKRGDFKTGDLLISQGLAKLEKPTFRVTSKDGMREWARLRFLLGYKQGNFYESTKATFLANLVTIREELLQANFRLTCVPTFVALGTLFLRHTHMAIKGIGPGKEQAKIEKLVRKDIANRKQANTVSRDLKFGAGHYAAVDLWADVIGATRSVMGFPIAFADVQKAMTRDTPFDLLTVSPSTNIAAEDLIRRFGDEIKVFTEMSDHNAYTVAAYDLFLVSEHGKNFNNTAEASAFITKSLTSNKQLQFAIYALHKRTQNNVYPTPSPRQQIPAMLALKDAGAAKATEKERMAVKSGATGKETSKKGRATRKTKSKAAQGSERSKKKAVSRKTATTTAAGQFEDKSDAEE